MLYIRRPSCRLQIKGIEKKYKKGGGREKGRKGIEEQKKGVGENVKEWK
jgi:hypothetical protein